MLCPGKFAVLSGDAVGGGSNPDKQIQSPLKKLLVNVN